MQFRIFKRSWLVPTLEGLIPDFRSPENTLPSTAADKTAVWRDCVLDQYSVSDAWRDKPVDLSNVLILKTRERQLLHSCLTVKDQVYVNAPKSQNGEKKYFEQVETELTEALHRAEEFLYTVKDTEPDFPVAFASNTWYAMEVNGV